MMEIFASHVFLAIYFPVVFLPLVLIWIYRKKRVIQIRGLKYVTEFYISAGIYCGMTLASLFQEELLNCFWWSVMAILSIGKCWVPFLLFYRQIFLKYRFGAVDSFSDDLIARPWPVKIARKYCIYRPTFLKEVRVFEGMILTLMLLNTNVLSDAKDPIQPNINECLTSVAQLVNSGISLIQSGSLLLLGYGICGEFNIISKDHKDRLGIKTMMIGLNRLMFWTLLSWVIVTGVSLTNMIPPVISGIISLSIFFYEYQLLIVPLIQALYYNLGERIRDGESGSDVTSELGLLEQYIRTTEGHLLMTEFFKSELCIECLLFIQDTDIFASKYNRKQKKKTRQNNGSQEYSIATSTSRGSGFLVTNGGSHVSNSRPKQSDRSNKISDRSVDEHMMMYDDAMQIYTKYLDPNAPFLINAESLHTQAVKQLLVDAAPPVAATIPTPLNKKGHNKNAVVPGEASSAITGMGSSTSSGSIIGRGDSFASTDSHATDRVTRHLFEPLRRSQLELIYHDVFQRYREVPQYEQSWQAFRESIDEIVRLENGINQLQQANSSISGNSGVSSSHAEGEP